MSASDVTWSFDDVTVTSALPTAMTSVSSPSTFDRFRVILNVYVVGIVCAFGITGNLVSMAVLGRDRTIRRTTGFLLQALAASDTAYLVACLLYQTTKTVHDVTDWGSPGSRRVWPYIEPYVWPLASIAQTCTVWVVVVVTADRYVAICRPLHAPQYSTVSRARTSVIVCWVVAIVYNLPRFFERATAHANDVSAVVPIAANLTTTTSSPEVVDSTSPYVTSSWTSDSGFSAAIIGHPHVVRTSLHENTIYIVVYRTGLFFIARFLIPFSALAFFNTRLIMAVRNSTRLPGRHRGSSAGTPRSRSPTNNLHATETRRRLSPWQQRQNTPCVSSSSVTSAGARKERYTLTLVVVVIVFVACELPDMFLRAWLALHSCLPAAVPFPRGALMFVNGASNLCLTLNSSVNFLVYCFVGQRFRVVLIRMICPARLRLVPHPSATSLLLASDGYVTRTGAFRSVGGVVVDRDPAPGGSVVGTEDRRVMYRTAASTYGNSRIRASVSSRDVGCTSDYTRTRSIIDTN